MNKLILRYIVMVLLIVSIFFASACSDNDILSGTTASKINLNITTSTINLRDKSELSTTYVEEKATQKFDISLDIGGADLILHKYRMNYYTIPAPFAKIVESSEFENWYSQIILLNPDETNVMVIKEFILKFDVSKEDFERANLEWAKIVVNNLDGVPMMNPQDFSNQETDEVYNVDILYTFDDEIINNYYLSHEYPYTFSDEYEKAVENGEYVSQTTDWIDIEEMEAEIIAKYGEAEIVAETTTAIPEKIVTSDLPQIETNE